MTADLLERTRYTTRQLLAAAKMEWKDIDRLLLVGGSTRMPMVVDMLRKLSGKEPDHTVNPDEAVARGAALYAAYLLAKEKGSGAHADLDITNVNSHSLGVEGIDPETLRKKNVRSDSAQYAAAGQGQGAIRHEDGEPAIDRDSGSRRREHAAGRMYGHRANRDPRPSRRPAEELADRSHVRVCRQRASDRQRDGAGHAPRRHARIWNAPPECRTRASRDGSGRSATRPASTSSSRWSKRCWHCRCGGARDGADDAEGVAPKQAKLTAPTQTDSNSPTQADSSAAKACPDGCDWTILPTGDRRTTAAGRRSRCRKAIPDARAMPESADVVSARDKPPRAASGVGVARCRVGCSI